MYQVSVEITFASRIRFNDKNTVDVAQLRAQLDGFMNRVSALFLQRRAHQVHSYTQHAPQLNTDFDWTQFIINDVRFSVMPFRGVANHQMSSNGSGCGVAPEGDSHQDWANLPVNWRR